VNNYKKFKFIKSVQVDEVGQVSLPDILPRRIVMLNYTLVSEFNLSLADYDF